MASALRKVVLVNSNGLTVIEALRGLKAHWGLSSGLIAGLERALATDVGDYPSRNKLRLLRMVEAFHTNSSLYQLALGLKFHRPPILSSADSSGTRTRTRSIFEA